VRLIVLFSRPQHSLGKHESGCRPNSRRRRGSGSHLGRPAPKRSAHSCSQSVEAGRAFQDSRGSHQFLLGRLSSSCPVGSIRRRLGPRQHKRCLTKLRSPSGARYRQQMRRRPLGRQLPVNIQSHGESLAQAPGRKALPVGNRARSAPSRSVSVVSGDAAFARPRFAHCRTAARRLGGSGLN